MDQTKIIKVAAVAAAGLIAFSFLGKGSEEETIGGSGGFGGFGGGGTEETLGGDTGTAPTFNITFPETPTFVIPEDRNFSPEPIVPKKDAMINNSSKQLLKVEDVNIKSVLDVGGANDFIKSKGVTPYYLGDTTNLPSQPYNEQTMGDMGASELGSLTTGASITDRIVQSVKSGSSGGTGGASVVTKKEAVVKDYGASELGSLTRGGSVTDKIQASRGSSGSSSSKTSSKAKPVVVKKKSYSLKDVKAGKNR